jgi:hypothetical protein
MATPANVSSRSITTLACLLVLGACNSPQNRAQTQAGAGGSEETGGTGSGGTTAPTGGKGGSSSGGSTGAVDSGATGGSPGTGGVIGTGGSTGGGLDAPVEKPAGPDAMSMSTDAYPDSDFLPGRPDIRLCKKEWNMEQCCAFLCSCLNTICADSAKAKPGLASCMTWCPKISNMAARCHVYHCYISISPTGGIKDHDSHCGHAANQVAGGGCPTVVYQ